MLSAAGASRTCPTNFKCRMTSFGAENADFKAWVIARHAGQLCTYGPVAERQPVWVVQFEDRDRGEARFTDEAEAIDYFLRASANWNCTLLTTVRVPGAADSYEGLADMAKRRKPKAKTKPRPGNLARNYPLDFLRLWDGCWKKDCLPQCRGSSPETAYCERLEREFADYQDAAERMDNWRNTGGKSYR